MEYALPIILVLVIVAAAVAAFVLNARRKTTPSHHDRVAADHEHGGGPGIGADETPLGDTAEHAGRQSRTGETLTPPDATRFGGTGGPVTHYGATVPEDRGTAGPPPDQGIVADPGEEPVKGERRIHRPDGDPPDSDRLADRRA